MTGPVSRFAAIRGLRLHYLEWGSEANPPLLLVHGGLDSANSWAWLAPHLADRWHVLAIDLRGHGMSDWDPGGGYEPLAHIEDLALFLDEVCGGRAAVVSHSMGARLSLMLAAVRPEAVDALVAIEGINGGRMFTAGATPVTDRMQAWIEERKRLAAAEEPARIAAWIDARADAFALHRKGYADLDAATARLLDDSDKRLTPEQARHIAETMTRHGEHGALVWRFDPLVRVQGALDPSAETLRSYWRAIRCPVLHLFGADSWAMPPAEIDLASFADARLEVLPGAGHWVHLNQPALVLAAVSRFLAERAARSGTDNPGEEVADAQNL